ncbi:MAG: prepilin-type N-terminal cleavage/methylation domain-containing protein [Planctomycetes bacterium]|nr:prepilin-type N-terminal cleavage/methylation domain-containing protein [Planctomycetota bacterium]
MTCIREPRVPSTCGLSVRTAWTAETAWTRTSTTTTKKKSNRALSWPAREGRRAFTLIEVLIVAVILGLVLSIAIVRMDNLLPASRLNKHMRDLADTCEMAFSQAAVQGYAIALYLDTSSRTTRLENYLSKVGADEMEQEGEFIDFDSEASREPILEMKWHKNIELEEFTVEVDDDEDSRDFILFSPEGFCDGARIRFRDSSGLTQTLELWPLLGRTEILPQEEY